MKVRILKSPYPQLAIGTIGELRGAINEHHVSIRVDGTWPEYPIKCPELGKTDLAFPKADIEIISEKADTLSGPELIFVQSFNSLAREIHQNARDKGFWKLRDEMIAVCKAHSDELGNFAVKSRNSQLRELTVSEISEACEADRKDLLDDKIPQYDGKTAEMADAVIRIMDMAIACGMPIAEAIISKMRFNKTRPHMHGGKAF